MGVKLFAFRNRHVSESPTSRREGEGRQDALLVLDLLRYFTSEFSLLRSSGEDRGAVLCVSSFDRMSDEGQVLKGRETE